LIKPGDRVTFSKVINLDIKTMIIDFNGAALLPAFSGTKGTKVLVKIIENLIMWLSHLPHTGFNQIISFIG